MQHNSIAWKNGQWLPFHEVNLALDDWGVLQGAIVVDRLRTINSLPLDVELHLLRLRANCETVGIRLSESSIENISELAKVIRECAQHNLSRLSNQDFSIVVLVTPGTTSGDREPTVIVHVQPLNRAAIQHWHTHGQQLIVSDRCNVPAACWPPNLKTRSRLHYYLADRAANRQGSPHCAAVLLDLAGNITETSAANILCVDRQSVLHCPPMEDILQGISLQRTLRLVNALSMRVEHHPISVDFAEDASEVILTGTSGCIWPASQFGQHSIQNPTEQSVYRQLLDAWIADVGCDFRKM